MGNIQFWLTWNWQLEAEIWKLWKKQRKESVSLWNLYYKQDYFQCMYGKKVGKVLMWEQSMEVAIILYLWTFP